eukprot:1136612-Pelagomonas_calceolata.AAC.4
MSASNVQVQQHSSRVRVDEEGVVGCFQQALSAQQTARLAGSQPLPFWAILAIFFLGWNEFMSLLYNPALINQVSLTKPAADTPH